MIKFYSVECGLLFGTSLCLSFLSHVHVSLISMIKVQDDPKLPGDSGHVPISERSGW
jgi:hypothetical protein